MKIGFLCKVMKTYRTVVTPSKPEFAISHQDKLISIGSCFSENTGKKFREYKFNININPFGQQYNPHSIAQAIERLLNPVAYTEADLVRHNELYHSFDQHGDFSHTTAAETLKHINDNLTVAAEDIKRATVLFLTFGTSHVFVLKEKNKVVSNCHKFPGNMFGTTMMNPLEIVEVLEATLKKLLTVNPGIKIVLTVSPVRYFAFGHYENSVSKANIFSAIYELQNRHPNIYYFPAYELVIDDLRDYRFYAEDMLHPNHQATEYVWENLCNTMFSEQTLKLLREIDEVLQATKHRPRNPTGEAHKKFVAATLNKIEELEKLHRLDLSEEKERLMVDSSRQASV